MPPKTFYNPVSSPGDIRAKSTEMLKEIVGDPDIARLLERATWNHAVMFCKRKEQPLNWDNSAFRYAYTQKVLGVRYIARERPEVLELLLEPGHDLGRQADAIGEVAQDGHEGGC